MSEVTAIDLKLIPVWALVGLLFFREVSNFVKSVMRNKPTGDSGTLTNFFDFIKQDISGMLSKILDSISTLKSNQAVSSAEGSRTHDKIGKVQVNITEMVKDLEGSISANEKELERYIEVNSKEFRAEFKALNGKLDKLRCVGDSTG